MVPHVNISHIRTLTLSNLVSGLRGGTEATIFVSLRMLWWEHEDSLLYNHSAPECGFTGGWITWRSAWQRLCGCQQADPQHTGSLQWQLVRSHFIAFFILIPVAFGFAAFVLQRWSKACRLSVCFSWGSEVPSHDSTFNLSLQSQSAGPGWLCWTRVLGRWVTDLLTD